MPAHHAGADEEGYSCAAGLSCDPVFKRCFSSPRKVGSMSAPLHICN